jgi:ribosomal subunit interface protein
MLQIAFRGMEPSDAVEQRVRERAERLARLNDRITHCNVVIQAPHNHRHKGKLYEIRIQLQTPGAEILVNREGSQNPAHEDIYVAVRDAFEAAERQLAELSAKRGHHR